MSTFTSTPCADHGFNLKACDGPLVTLLGYDAADLMGDGWRQTVAPWCAGASARMAADMRAGRGGRYTMLNHSKDGDRIAIQVRTLARDGRLHGQAHLEWIEVNRRHVHHGR